MRFRFVDHTADVEFIAYGKTDNELFANALAAVFETIADTKGLKRSKERVVKLNVDERADRLDELLWNTLQYSLSYAESKGVFAYEVGSIEVRDEKGVFSCSASINTKAKSDRFSKLGVKGVSRYELKIKKGKTMEARVVLDV